MKYGFSTGPCQTRRVGTVSIARPTPIEAIIDGTGPSLGALRDGDTLSSAVTWGSYRAGDGYALAGATTRQTSLDGGQAWADYDGLHVARHGETVLVRERVATTTGEARTFTSGAVTVAGQAPTLAASASLDGRVLTIRVDSLAGLPGPVATLSALALDGADVRGAAMGSGPWSYAVPDSAAAQTLAWEVTATNAVGSATASGSETVPASLAAPVLVSATAISAAAPSPGDTVEIAWAAVSGSPAPIRTDTLLLEGSDVTADLDGTHYTIPPGTEAGLRLTARSVADNGIGAPLVSEATATIAAPVAWQTETGTGTIDILASPAMPSPSPIEVSAGIGEILIGEAA